MNKLLELLKKNTQEGGSYSLVYNEHKNYYHTELEDIAKDYLGCCDEEDIKDFKEKIDIAKPIYCLTWYPSSPVGFYILYANSIKDLTKDLQELIKQLDWVDKV